MTTALLVSVVVTPLVLAALASGRRGSWLTMLAPLPAFAVAALMPTPESVTLEGVLLGTRIGLDDVGRMFLGASALVWVVAAVYAAGSVGRSRHAARFRIFFLLTMTGNFALILAQDMVTFFLGFTLMGLSAYGLVAHRQSSAARGAARLYLRWTIVGETSLFCAVLLIAANAGGVDFASLQVMPPPDIAVALVVLGFGIKLALPGLHVWLPLTYCAAPAAGAAVLSGPMISAGLLGWLRFLPAGDNVLFPWGEFLAATGMLGTVLGVTAGVLQRSPRAVLGYSSISKMGVLTTGVGIMLAAPSTAPLMISALVLYAIYHMLAKSALFIGIDLLQCGKARGWVLTGLTLAALALTGVPLTGGAHAKAALTDGLPEGAAWFGTWLMVTAFASSLILGRLLYLVSITRPSPRPINSFSLAGWTALIVIVLMSPLVLSTPTGLLSGALPIAGGALLSLLVWRYRPQRLADIVGCIPPGDVLHFARRVLRLGWHALLRPGALRAGHALGPLLRWPRLAIAWATTRPIQPRLASMNWYLLGALWMSLGGAVLLVMTIRQ